jgi:hypothetical protein
VVAKDLEVELRAATGNLYTCDQKYALFFDNGVAGAPAYNLLYAWDESGTGGYACAESYASVDGWLAVELQGDSSPSAVPPVEAVVHTMEEAGERYLVVELNAPCLAYYSTSATDALAAYNAITDEWPVFGLDGELIKPVCLLPPSPPPPPPAPPPAPPSPRPFATTSSLPHPA